ncbi:MAG: hypothetical protein IPH72_20190 [Sandaracinaceae bacterium]|jgi:hypothetical protein|nr:hypothetical protein [Sandaracinaceae bacterium]MBP7682176.1 hypothetical protein [Deltaproteobacteria bacterium]
MKHTLLALLFALPCLVAACSSDSGPTRPRDGGSDSDGAVTDGSMTTDTGNGLDTGMQRDTGLNCAGGTLCGTPVMCCAAGNECIGGACLPTCATGVRCGADSSVCCGSGQVCLSNACASPTVTCGDSYDCEPGEFCEPTIGRCLPQPVGGPTCVYTPTFGILDPVIERSWETQQVISIPVVADLDADGTPEIVVSTTQMDGASFQGGRIVVLDGASPGATFLEEVAPIPHNPPLTYGSHGRTSIAVGDVSGDARPDIVYIARSASSRSLVVAIGLDDQGGVELHWTSFTQATPGDSPTPYGIAAAADANGAVTLANFDDDPMAEVVVGAMIFDHDGRLIWDAGTNGSGANFGTNSGYSGGIAVVADLDADGTPELISGRNAYQVAWTPASTGVLASATVTPFWVAAGNDGYPAVADLDGDGTPEVVLVASRQVILLNGQTGDLWCVAAGQCSTPLNIPGGASTNRGGPPTIADFDGDGRAEIGVAGGFSYSVYDVYRPGEDLVYPNGDPAPAPGALYVRWSSTTQDTSSNSTGSSVFDFEGDGAAEVVYADECFLRVYSGTNGVLQLQEPSTSATIHEYPLVVDADGDGNSEILLVANDAGAAGNCGAGVPTRRGLFMYGDTNDAWVPTRRVWTQHAYHVTNASSAGNVPLDELPNWLQPRLNNARQNVQGDGVFNAPDVAVDLSVGLASCPDTHQLRARVTNLGALGVYMGVPVRFERTTGGTVTLLGTAATTMPLLPGQSEVVTFDAPALEVDQDYRVIVDFDDAGAVDDVVNECDENNNANEASGARCDFFE